MANKKAETKGAKKLNEQMKKVEKSFAEMLKSNEKLRKEIERMKELMNYVPGSISKEK